MILVNHPEGVDGALNFAGDPAALAQHQNDGHTAVTIQRVHPLAEAAQAFKGFEADTLGKLVVTLD